MITLYGIKACDTCRKAQKNLTASGVSFTFHDLREDGLNEARLSEWITAVGADTLVNKRSTTWRQLDEAKKSLDSDKDAVALLLENPTLVKRPVMQNGQIITVGWTAQSQAAHGITSND